MDIYNKRVLGSSVGIVSGYELDDEVRSPAEAKGLFL
jgi:hypothetical protein